ncbi:MAG: hypothetical protein ABI585_15390 [Betaproteobacteria bacterium]
MSAPRISVVYTTAREDPAFHWFADGLARQLPDDADVEVLLVDSHCDAARTERFEAAVRGRFELRHVPPKPSPYQGPHRVTRRDFFSAASARNGGIAYARAPYVVFADDCSVPMPGWWRGIERAARHGHAVTGAFQRHWGMTVEDNLLVESRLEPDGLDGRWSGGDDARPVRVYGGQLYTPTFAAPREALLAVNGFDELCDTIGFEDCQLGIRMGYAGIDLHYDRSMTIVKSQDHNSRSRLVREDRVLPPDAYLERLAEFGVPARRTNGNFDSSQMLLDIVLGTESPATHGNYYWLADLTPGTFDRTRRRFPVRHWFDDVPLATL